MTSVSLQLHSYSLMWCGVIPHFNKLGDKQLSLILRYCQNNLPAERFHQTHTLLKQTLVKRHVQPKKEGLGLNGVQTAGKMD